MGNDILESLNMSGVKHSIILVAGVGGAGGNALNNMVRRGINDVTFMACNTDKQALAKSLAPIRVQLGEGLGAGNNPQRGADAAKESLDDIFEVLRSEETKMLFITAGMGGGTGTGASPVIAKAARELGVLTVAVVTTPFSNEGQKRVHQAMNGIEELKQNVDAILIINNDSIGEAYGDMPLEHSFAMADDILASAVKGIAELITIPGIVNVDFADVQTALTESGNVLLGTARANGDDRALKVAQESLNSLLLRNHDIRGAKDILLNIVYSDEHPLYQNEQNAILSFFQTKTGGTANIVWGTATNPELGDNLELVAVIAGFDNPGVDLQAPEVESESESQPADEPQPAEQVSEEPVEAESVTIVQFKGEDRYTDIDKTFRTPAYVRQGVQLDSMRGKSAPQRKSELKVEEPEQPQTPASNSGTLFDL